MPTINRDLDGARAKLPAVVRAVVENFAARDCAMLASDASDTAARFVIARDGLSTGPHHFARMLAETYGFDVRSDLFGVRKAVAQAARGIRVTVVADPAADTHHGRPCYVVTVALPN